MAAKSKESKGPRRKMFSKAELSAIAQKAVETRRKNAALRATGKPVEKAPKATRAPKKDAKSTPKKGRKAATRKAAKKKAPEASVTSTVESGWPQD